MRLCIGTSKGIVILDPARASTPVMVLADPSPIWCMAQDCANPALIYAGANDTLAHGRTIFARSEDAGRTWVDATSPAFRDEEIWALASSPAVPGQVYVGSSHGRLFKSDDRARSFYELTAFLKVPGRERWSFPPPPHIPHVRSISFAPQNPDTVYVGVEEGGVFRSTDGGDSFRALNSGLYEDVHSVSVDPRDSRRLYATTGRGFYFSNNSGESWRHVKSGMSRPYTVPLMVLSESGSIFTAAAAGPPPTWRVGPRGADAVVFCSEDGGESFQPVANTRGPKRGMLMRFRPALDRDEFFAVSTDGTLARESVNGGPAELVTITEKLPPAYDLVVVP